MKESQVLLQKDSGGKAKELLPLMQGPAPALHRDKGTGEESCAVTNATQGSAGRAHQAGFAEGLIYLTSRTHRLSLGLPWSKNEVHKSELSHLSEKRCAGSVHRSGLWALVSLLELLQLRNSITYGMFGACWSQWDMRDYIPRDTSALLRWFNSWFPPTFNVYTDLTPQDSPAGKFPILT